MTTRVAIVGGGTSGFMAAVHLSHFFPSIELTLIVDPRIPTIGVGEGTTAGFRSWLDEIAGASYDELQREMRVTPKHGIRFENWGHVHQTYTHLFVPTEGAGLHLSAALLVVFLRKFVRGEIVEAHVTGIEGSASQAVIKMEERDDLTVDVAIDARGFPRTLTDEHIALSWIPTSAAMVTRTPRINDLEWTRAVARPHGWIFVIALTEDTAYGYIYGSDAASFDEVKADFDEFLAGEGVTDYVPPRPIAFPNFLCKEPFRDRVLKIGNAASFIEPLEATSIAVTRYQLNYLGAWLRAFEASPALANQLARELNRQIVELVMEVSLFIGWHYAEGAPFDTPFWRGARERFQQGLDLVPPHVRERFFEQLEHAAPLESVDFAQIRTAADLDRLLPQHRGFPPPFGGMTPMGFAQVGRGIGYRAPSLAR